MLKLGQQTASVTNWAMSGHAGQPAPEVGMGATILHWTDRTACTVVAFDGKTLTVQEDSATRTDGNGMSDAQSYAYERNPAGATREYRQDRRGQWRPIGTSERGRVVFTGGPNLRLGDRSQYHDFGF